MYLKIFCIILTAFSLLSCNKYENEKDDFSGEGYIAGRLTYKDMYGSDQGEKHLSLRKIYIAYSPTDTANFLYSRQTDADGYFIFEHLDQNRDYALFFADTVGKVRYAAFISLRPDMDTLKLIATNDQRLQNGLQIVSTDSAGNQIPGVQYCLFSNPALAMGDSCIGNVLQGTTDKYARNIHYDITPGIYYVVSRYQQGISSFKALDTITINEQGIITLTVRLKVVVKPETGFSLLVLDSLESPVNGARICVFINQLLFSADTCLGNIFERSTDQQGKHIETKLAPGTYYLRTSLNVGNINQRSMDTVIVIKDTIVKDTIRL